MAGWQVDGKTYALPFSVGVVGFWYNKMLFEKAGITSPPATMDEFYAAVDKLEAAGIAPVSVGAGDKWPAAHYWYYTRAARVPEAGAPGRREEPGLLEPVLRQGR